MKGALNTPDGKRPHSHRMGKTEGNIKRQGFKRHSRHEGLAPVRYSQRPETGSGLLRANSCRTSDRSACLFPRGPGPCPRLMTRGSWLGIRGPWVSLFALIGSAAAESDKYARASAIRKRRQPFACFVRPRNPKQRQEGTIRNPVFLAILSFPADRRSDRESKVAPGQADAAYGFPIVRFAAVGSDTRPPAASFEGSGAEIKKGQKAQRPWGSA